MFSLVVGTFGADVWADRGEALAAELVGHPLAVDVHHVHDVTLARARNEGARRGVGSWLVFVDADDRLEPGYLAAMADAAGVHRCGLLAPRVRYVAELDDPDPPPPTSFTGRDIRTMNPCAIGTAIRRAVFDDVGGFWAERAWEDWSLFRRAWLAGEPVVEVVDAVYRARTSPDGRNATVADPAGLHREIRRSHAAWRRQRMATLGA